MGLHHSQPCYPRICSVNRLRYFAESLLSSEGRKNVSSFHLVISTHFAIFGVERVTFMIFSGDFRCINDTVHGHISDITV